MGRWGYFDDECDEVADILYSALTPVIQRIPVSNRQMYIDTHLAELAKVVLDYIKLHSLQNQSASLVVGLAVALAREIRLTPHFSAYPNQTDRGFGFPAELFDEYPQELREMALAAAKERYDEFDATQLMRGPLDLFLTALRMQISLFEPRQVE